MSEGSTDVLVQRLLLGASAACIGGALWLLFVADVGSRSGSTDRSSGAASWLWIVGLAVAAFVEALVERRFSWLFVGMLCLPALLLVPMTAPRGDNDGLWILWFPYVVVVAGSVSAVSGFLGASLGRRRSA